MELKGIEGLGFGVDMQEPFVEEKVSMPDNSGGHHTLARVQYSLCWVDFSGSGLRAYGLGRSGSTWRLMVLTGPLYLYFKLYS